MSEPYIWEENGTTFIDNSTKWFPAKNEYLIVNDIIRALFVGYRYEKLPANVKALVDAKMANKK